MDKLSRPLFNSVGGSMTAPDGLRFDFSHPKPIGADELAAVEAIANAVIRQNAPVETRLMDREEAMRTGAMALFGEKYGDEVRVVSMGVGQGGEKADKAWSVELCGGTHVRRTGDIGIIKVLGDSASSAGVRRIEALTGEAARLWLSEREAILKDVAGAFKTNPEDVPARVAALIEERKRLERELAEAKKALATGGGGSALTAGPEDIGGVSFAGQVLNGLDPKELRGLVDETKGRLGEGVAATIVINDGRASVAVGVTGGLTSRFSAVDLVKAAVAALGGQGGGGRPDMAQGGGPDGDKAEDALAAIRSAIAA